MNPLGVGPAWQTHHQSLCRGKLWLSSFLLMCCCNNGFKLDVPNISELLKYLSEFIILSNTQGKTNLPVGFESKCRQRIVRSARVLTTDGPNVLLHNALNSILWGNVDNWISRVVLREKCVGSCEEQANSSSIWVGWGQCLTWNFLFLVSSAYSTNPVYSWPSKPVILLWQEWHKKCGFRWIKELSSCSIWSSHPSSAIKSICHGLQSSEWLWYCPALLVFSRKIWTRKCDSVDPINF